MYKLIYDLLQVFSPVLSSADPTYCPVILHYKYIAPFPLLLSPQTGAHTHTHTYPVSLASLSSPPLTPRSSLLPAQQGPSPCEHGGSCINTPGSFNCLCLPGYTGSRCEADHNECLSQPCHPGSTCLDLLATFQCLCPPGRAEWDCGWARWRTNLEPKGSCLASVSPSIFLSLSPTKTGEPTTPRRASCPAVRVCTV